MGLGTVVAKWPALTGLDSALVLYLHRYASPTLNAIVLGLTDLATLWGVLPATLGLSAWLGWQRRWRESYFLVLTMLGTLVLSLLAKLLWHRERPHLWAGVSLPSDYSFPSGHATYSLAFVLAIILLTWYRPKRLWIIALSAIFVVFIGFTRVYLGVHYPSDIVGGWLLAIAWTLGLYQVLFRSSARNF